MRSRRVRKSIIAVCFIAAAAAFVFLPLSRYIGSRKPLKIISPGTKCDIVKRFTFADTDSLKEWDEKVFRNKVAYSIDRDENGSFVKASSSNAASALYYKINLESKTRKPVILWRWRVDKFPVKKAAESLERENEDDFAARVYVIFPAMFITNSKVLEYVWSETIPEGTVGTSPYSKNIKLIALRKGIDTDNKWRTEERDVAADYVKLFGVQPEKNIGAIAFMTNTEHTGDSAEAMYGGITVGYKK